jgi:cytochrome c556
MKNTLFLSLTLIGISGIAIAQNSAISERQMRMKETAKATKPVAAMLKGTEPFNISVVQSALQTYAKGAAGYSTLFPEDSKTGGDTEASPKIWQEKSVFDALVIKFEKSATLAASSIKDEASFKSEFPKILGQCKECHDSYRVK